MFEVIENENTVYYINKKHNLKLKANKFDNSYYVSINLNRFNPVFSMLLGGFENECELSGITFDVMSLDGSNSPNSDCCVISIKDMKAFATEVYCFIVENHVADILRETDRVSWDF